MEINDTNKTPVKLGTTLAMAGKREEGEKLAKSVMPNNSDQVLDLFCGLGGWSKGFAAAGYSPTGVDIKDVGYPYRLITMDLTKAKGNEFGYFPVIVGSPECRDFGQPAIFGKYYWKIPPDPEGHGMDLVKAFFRIVETIKPEYWLMENVPGLAKYLKLMPLMTVNFTRTMKRTLWGNIPLVLLPQDSINNPRLKADITGKYRSWQRAEIPFHVSFTIAEAIKKALVRSV